MSESSLIRENLDDGVVRLILNRAPVNALSAEFLMTFAKILDDLEKEPGVKAVIISSAFKVFSAGLDLKEAQQFDLAAQTAIVEGLNVGFLTQFSFPKPLVVAIDGAAIAGGLFFILGGDYRIATARAQFGLAEVRVGADFPIAPLEIARATLDPNELRRLMLTGMPIKAEAAHARGIVDELVAADDLMACAMRAARQLASHPPNTFASVKSQIRGPAIATIKTGMETPVKGWFNEETIAAMQRMFG